MDTLTVRWSAIRGEIQSMEQIEDCLETIVSNISSINCGLSFSGSASANITQSLKMITQDISGERQTVSRLGAVLTHAISRYQSCESEIAGIAQKDVAGNADSFEEEYSDNSESADMLAKLLKSLIGKFGVIGKGTGAVIDFFDDEKSIGEKVTKGFSAAAGIAGVIGKWMSKGMKNDEFLAYFFGLNSKTILEDSTFLGALQKEFSNYLFENSDDMTGAVKVGDRLSVAAKWAGGVLTLIEKGFENYDEYQKGEISAQRAVAETVMETAVDLGTDALLTAGATAGLAAMGITAAPAVVIGGGVVLAKWGMDYICENMWGKDFTEVVSDGILDMGEAIAEGIGYVASNVAEGAKIVWDTVGEAVGEAAKSAADGVISAWGSFTNWAFG